MKTIYNDLVKVRNPETGAFEDLLGIRGESAYEIAVRLGKFSGTEEEWIDQLKHIPDSAVELTQAEYDALPDTKLSDNTTYFVTDGDSPIIIRNGITYGGESDSSSITFDLLWTNASPTSNFAEQTIELDLTGYTAVYFYYKILANASDGAYGGRLFSINNVEVSIVEGYFDASNIVVRHVWIKSTRIGFSNGIKNGGTNNSAIIPYKIYGVK